MSSAHTENLPADLNEHNEELADGCDNADTYLSAFYLCSFFLSLFSALWWWMNFCGKEGKKSSSSSSKSMILSLGWSATITFSFFVARSFSFTEKRFFSCKNARFLRFSRGWAKFFFPRSTYRAQVSSLFGGSMILVKEIRFWLVV